MAAHKLFKNHMLAISGIVLVIGVAATVWSFFGDDLAAGLWDSYVGIFPDDNADWNLWVRAIGGVVLLFGLWNFVEQVLLRRKFDKLIDTAKKGDFIDRRSRLEDLTRRLPDVYRTRLLEKEASFVSKR